MSAAPEGEDAPTSTPSTEPPAERLAAGDRVRVWTALLGAFVLMGALRAAIGPALLPFAERVEASAAALSRLGSVQALGATLIVLASGPLLPRLGQRRLLLASFVLMALGGAGFALGGSVLWLAAGALLVGLGTGAVELGGNTLLGRLYGARSAGPLNLVAAMFGVGAIAGPALLALVGQRADLTFGICALLAAALLPSLLGVRVPGADAERPGGAAPPGAAPPALAWGPLAGIAAAFFLYVGIEASVGTLLALHLEANRGAAFATLATSFFWGALMLGRFGASAFADRVPPRALTTAALLLGGGALATTASPAFAPAGYVLAGLLLAPVFPTMLAALQRAYPGRRGIATSVALVSASAGAIVLIGVNGWLVERGGVAGLPLQYLATALPATLLAWVFLGRAARLERAA